MTTHRDTAQQGFTMLEILFVLALSFVGLFGMTSVLVISQRSAQNARYITEASALAQDRIEWTVHNTVAAVQAMALGPVTESNLGPTGQAVPGGLYTRTTTVTVVNNISTVRVTVSWPDPAGRPIGHSVNL